MAGLVKWSARRKFGAFAASLALVGAASTTSAAAATRPTAVTATRPAAAARAGHKGGKLSPRLLALSRNPRALALGLPRSGAGSLVWHADGRLVVQVRMSNWSPISIGRLTSLGAQVVSTSPEYRTVTADVAPRALRAIAKD